MIWKDIRRETVFAGVLLGVALLCGCSRSTLNYQIAESIGTVGMYANNEPVETPKMQVEREQREAAEAQEAELAAILEDADRLAEGYWYDEAIARLGDVSGEDADDERVTAALARYQEEKESLTAYEGAIAHLCFPGLIEDTMRAFDGDDLSYTYESSMVTTKEFKGILQSLYDNGYVLVDIHDVGRLERDDVRSVSTLELQPILLPPGKKPIIISQDNLSYAGIKNGDGIATKLTMDEEGRVKALYTDDGGHDLAGDYDLVPILDTFVEEHPDFSLRGAKGIVSVSGVDGVFGYQVSDTTVTSFEENREKVKAIAEALLAEGWRIASAGYAHTYMDSESMTLEALSADIGRWQTDVGSLTGETDILFFPYGAEVEYPSEQLNYLLDEGFVYFCGLWASEDHLETGDGYLRQTRRFIDGYTLENVPDYFTSFFSAAQILDTDR